ncbi:hypothetical protein [Sphingobacterium sp. UGAL515B_05]|uniref:hypothetical protein n=1 Tax=Sphingobacterium sp. UGAL515B_05 TaxID=2986767 RepID=UPI0029545FB5|nr:hypothetical protein [Sphingobacterium sp. UGAL515B_05]WON94775.1 hypothetical protein OK025_26510 [Sphingobacterium sp. UGAL515B_05]
MEKLNINFNAEPLFWQLTKNEGATIALAKAQLSENEFKIFLIESEIQQLYSMLDLIDIFGQMFTEKETLSQSANRKIIELKKERDDLKKSA